MGQAQSNPPAPPPQDGSPQDCFPPDRLRLVDPYVQVALASFQCPYQMPDKSFPHTPYYCRHKSNCPFGHQDPDSSSSTNLRALPKCFCVDSLMGMCKSTQLERLDPGNLVRCESGFHPDEHDLVLPERFVRLVAGAILGRSMLPMDAEEESDQEQQRPDCVVCLNPIPTQGSPISGCNLSGFLENCIHQFCGNCIQKWRLRRQRCVPDLRFECPTCRAPSSRIMIWPEADASNPTKMERLFAVQKAFFGLLVGPQTMFAIAQVGANDDVGFRLCFNGFVYLGKVVQDGAIQVIRPFIQARRQARLQAIARLRLGL